MRRTAGVAVGTWAVAALVAAVAAAGCRDTAPVLEAPGVAENAPRTAATAERWSYQDWPTGPYRVVEGWPKPLPDTRHSHAGWTWGSFGGV